MLTDGDALEALFCALLATEEAELLATLATLSAEEDPRDAIELADFWAREAAD